MRSYWIKVGPKPHDWCPYKERGLEEEKIHWKEVHMKTRAEMGVTLLMQDKEGQRLLSTSRG